MADLRVQPAVKIVDPTTNANEAGVTASGELKVVVNTAIAAGNNNIGDVDVVTEPATVANAGAIPSVLKVVAGYDGTNVRAIATNTSGHVKIEDGGNSITVDGSVTVSGTVAVSAVSGVVDVTPASPAANDYLPVRLTDGTTFMGVVDNAAVAAGQPGILSLGTDGSNYQVLSVNSSGRLQVDVTSGGGETAPSGAVNKYQTSAALAAGSTASLDTADLASGTYYLARAYATASVPFKAALHTVSNNTESTDPLAVAFGRAGDTVQFQPAHRTYWSVAGGTAGTDAFRIKMTNLDTSEAADVYAIFQYQTN